MDQAGLLAGVGLSWPGFLGRACSRDPRSTERASGSEPPEQEVILGERRLASQRGRRSVGPFSRVLSSAPCQRAERTGLEPAASGVTGRRYNQLNYRSTGGTEPTAFRGAPCWTWPSRTLRNPSNFRAFSGPARGEPSSTIAEVLIKGFSPPLSSIPLATMPYRRRYSAAGTVPTTTREPPAFCPAIAHRAGWRRT